MPTWNPLNDDPATGDSIPVAFLELEGRTLELRSCFIGAAPPASPVEGQFWVDNSASPYRVFQYLSTTPVEPRDVRTVMGEAVTGPTGSGPWYLFFVDQVPNANWAHPCAYAFVREQGGGETWAESEWPPADSIDLHRVSRR